MGYFAGSQGQGTQAIAIGYTAVQGGQAANSIVIDASGGIIPSPTTAGFYVAPVTSTNATTNVMLYNLTTNEIQYSTNPLPAPGQFYGDYVYWDSAFPGTWAVGNQNINIGSGAGESTTATGGRVQAVAVGYQAGNANQGEQAIAMGYNAGNYNQGTQSIAIGYFAGYSGQGANAIAIGYNAAASDQAANSIVLDASGGVINSTAVGGFYVAPVAGVSYASSVATVMVYEPTTGEITFNSGGAKTFVIDHPINDKKYLVHACLEGPEAGVYYRGKGEIVNDNSIAIELPYYVSAFATDFTIQVTPIYDGKIKSFGVSEIVDNKFTVYGENGKFYWIVHGSRSDVNVDPDKTAVEVKGSGPYLWI
jgi:hypothetical protein